MEQQEVQEEMTSCLRRVLLALALVLSLAVPTLAQQETKNRRSVDEFRVPYGQTEIRISDRDKIPARVLAVIRRAGCHLEDPSPELPIHIFKPEPQREQMIALVPCSGHPASGIAISLNRGDEEPRRMIFPVVVHPSGVGMIPSPGLPQWDAATQMLVATQRSDLCPDLWKRYTYRYQNDGGHQEAPFSWVLVKAEAAQNACDGRHEGWQTFFEAPALPAREPPRNVWRE